MRKEIFNMATPELQIARWIREVLWKELANFEDWESYIEWLIHLTSLPFENEEGDF